MTGVVVIHDVLGMSQDLRDQTDWLAGVGSLATAPDLYRGRRPLARLRTIVRDARERRGTTFDDIEAVRTWLTARADCTGRGAVIGKCTGGGFTLLLAPSGRYSVASADHRNGGKDAFSERFLAGACAVVASSSAMDHANRATGERLRPSPDLDQGRARHQDVPRRRALLPQRSRPCRRPRRPCRPRPVHRSRFPRSIGPRRLGPHHRFLRPTPDFVAT